MINLSIKRFVGATLAVSALSFTATASAADTIELSYNVWRIGLSIDYRGMGYTDPDGNFIDLAGNDILSSRVVVDFTPDPGVDISSFHMAMVVPVLGSVSQYFAVDASDLIEVTPGHFTYELTSSDYNGEIYSGRFSIEAYGLDAMGNPITLPGIVGDTTGYYYTVELPTAPVPEPASALLLLGGLALVPAFVRRRRQA